MFFLVPVLVYLALLLGLAVFVLQPSTLGWIGFGVVAAIGLVIGTGVSFLFQRARTNPAALHPRPAVSLARLLVVADTHCHGSDLCRAVEQAVAGRPVEVLVLAPVLASPLHFLTDAEEAERDDAKARLSEALEGLAHVGIEAHGLLGGDDPLQAIGDALAGFPADEILLAASGRERRNWLEHDLARKARDSYGVPVVSVTLAGATVPSRT